MEGALRATVSASPHISLNGRPALCLSRENSPAAATGSHAYRPIDCRLQPDTAYCTPLNLAVHAADITKIQRQRQYCLIAVAQRRFAVRKLPTGSALRRQELSRC
ncbi:hypothetical protein DPSP01_008641 [Paraphaeosphaeria sporulosa]